MALDEMLRFYHCAESELLDLLIPRFWQKYKNMQILRLQEKIEALHIHIPRKGASIISEVNKLVWKLEQLTGESRVDDISELKRKQPKLKSSSDLDEIKRLVNDQRRRRKKAIKKGEFKMRKK